MKRSLTGASVVLFAVMAFFSCRHKETIEILDSVDFDQEPDLVMTDFEYSSTTGNQKNWDLDCREAEKFDSLKKFLFKDLHFRLYEGKAVHAVLTAKFGSANYGERDMTAQSNVKVVFDDGTILRTQTLTWDDAREVLRTEDFVRIVKPDGDQITGYGLTMDKNADEIVIKHRVKGKFNNDGSTLKDF